MLPQTHTSSTHLKQVPEGGLVCLLAPARPAALIKGLISSYKFCLAYSLTSLLLQHYRNDTQTLVPLF